ncbi:MAG: adenylate/guanylate cyclase domain-containing protein, partial [Treponema sp.]|nr:adenylate/guanylate cyclase domain-containing protein [Treponema sp.]
MSELDFGEFLIFSGRNADRERMLAGNFNVPGFRPYNREKLVNETIGDNYHVFKTIFTISEYFADKNLTLYINRLDMPVIIRLNDVIVYHKGYRQHEDNAYATGEQAATHVPLESPLLKYNADNILVVEVFPQYETSSLPEISIAEYEHNVYKVFIKNFLIVYLVLASQLLGLLVSIYHFGSFISRGCKDPKYLFFSLLSLFFVCAYSNIGFSFDSKYYTELVKLTRCGQLLSVGFYLLFIIESTGLFPKLKKYINTAFIIYSIICAVFIAVQRNKYEVSVAFSLMTNIYLIPSLLCCVVIPVISIIINKNKLIVLILFTTLIVAGASLRDMLLLSAAAQPLFWFAPYAFFMLVIIIYGILVYEETSLFKNFKRYVPADLVIQLINKNIIADLGGEQQELTVFFSDIAKFTSITEKMEPEKVVQDLCVYFENISRTILANNGTIDKYIGDSVMAFWGAPVPMEDHASKACYAALTVQESLRILFEQWEHQGKIPFHTRIGIHTGNVLVGNLGYKERLNYTVMGDTVNVSSRLEGINKIYGTEIIVSDSVYKKCPDDFEFRHIDRVYLLGRFEAMDIYELIAFKDDI